MKNSWLIGALILGIGMVPGFLDLRRIHERRQENAALVAHGKHSENSSDRRGENPAGRERPPRYRSSPDQDPLQEILRISRALDEPDGTNNAGESAALIEMLSQLDVESLRQIFSALSREESISAPTRRSVIAFTLMALADMRPETVLALAADGAVEETGAVPLALGNLAKKNPQAAMAWLQANARLNGPDLNHAKRSMLAAVASNDPAHALQMMDDLGFKPGDGGIEMIATAAGESPDKRTAVLEAMRTWLAKLPENQRAQQTNTALAAIARNLHDEDFDSVTGWIEDVDLTAAEIGSFADGLSYMETKDETGEWIEWLGKNADSTASAGAVTDLMGEWTRQDYQAAGRWLAKAPAGPAKEQAVGAYAEAVAEYDPQVAVQWAMTLPQGERRTRALANIHANWPDNDKTGAAEFAQRHGIPVNPPEE
ncbi:MAG: hypothetical protein V4733_09665 [Verrucomicrobiota bacterium]